jgi:c-di-GMP-related signal transduction protein
VLPGQIYEAVASRVLAEHCLDEQRAWGVAGWPMEDVLHGYRHRQIQPGQQTITRLVEAIDADDSVEHIELILSEEPILAYRFLRYANSAALGRRTDIDSIRQGLMVLGLSLLRSWLLEQLPHASGDLNLQPVRTTLALRAHLMNHLLDAGDGDDLRREVYLCGLLSQMDLMLGEPLNAALARLPLSQRITSAILDHSGPYMPYLDVAAALESPNTQATRALCDLHQMNSEEVNRALLRTLSQIRPRPARGLLLA